MHFIPYVVLAFFLASCADDEYPVKLENNQVARLLTQNNSKNWFVDNGESCQADDILIFDKPVDTKTLGAFTYSKGDIFCPEESEEHITGTWEITSTGNTNQLTLNGETTIRYDIVLLTASTLRLRSSSGDFNYSASNR